VDDEIFKVFLKYEWTVNNPHLFNETDLINKLVAKKLLKYSINILETAQDSIIDTVLANEGLYKYLILSYRKWLSFYQILKKKNEDFLLPKSEIISWEILFRAHLEDFSGINTLLQEVYNLTLLSNTPKRAIRYLEKIKFSINQSKDLVNKDNFKKTIDFKIIQILYRLWYFDEIPLYSIEHLNDPIIFLFYISSLSLIGKANESIELCNEFIQNGKGLYLLAAYIIRLTSYRASNRYSECENEWKFLYDLKIFIGSPFEGLFYLASDFALISDHQNRLMLLKQSINIFEKESNTLNEISARNAYAQHLGYDGNLAEAEKQLHIAIVKAKKIFIRHYAIENNLSVLDIQKGITSKDIVDKLQEIATICENKIDRFIIWVNIFVAQSICKLNSDAEFTLRVIEQKIFDNEIQDFELKKIAFFNASIHYKKLMLRDISELYVKKYRAIPILMYHDYWNSKINDDQHSGEDDFRLSMDFYPVYITYWHFDFDTALNNSQLTI